MRSADLNLWIIPVAALAAWILGAGYYTALGKPWLAASGRTQADLKKIEGTAAMYVPMAMAFVAELVMAWVMAGVLAHLGPGQITVRNGLVSAFLLWLGFVLTTQATNNAYGGRKPMLTVIDTGHWLGVMLVIGAVIGAFGGR